ncbi:hypothetical protein FPV25_05465 [Carnobacterium sp. PL17GRE32]|uniref:hypothetical protein n=1 Tax=Carnobacterium sp. PL17GRE32 TaxID=2592355 RepID=UPI0011EC9160|nr:hypothetical protein [Carnobacterium sp. PL17GRE32]KAF3305157.1 hypothetical protein FPV25_05465 [Carnobacterium sp. PL17GRE32]
MDPEQGVKDVLADLVSTSTVNTFVVADDLSNLADAKEAVKKADAVVIMARLVATEGEDMKTAHQPPTSSKGQ